MNYKESKEILEEIKKAERILINVHRSCDPDSVGSSMGLKSIIQDNLDKNVTVIGVDESPKSFGFLPGANSIEIIDPASFDFSQFDLFLLLDSEQWQQAGISENSISNLKVIPIDHHPHNDIENEISIIDKKASSTSETVYLISKDWNFKVSSDAATLLLAGLMADTGEFKFVNTTARAFEIASKLMSLGADHDQVVLHLNQSNNFNLLKMWGQMLTRLTVDQKFNFAWSAVPYEVYKNYKNAVSPTKTFSDLFVRTVAGTDFGISMVEKEKGFLHLSFRSRAKDFDVSVIAKELGGGGHVPAAGAAVEGLDFDKAVAKVLQTARKFAKEK